MRACIIALRLGRICVKVYMGNLASNSVKVLPNLIKIGQKFRDNLHGKLSMSQCREKLISPRKHWYVTLDNFLIFDSDMRLKTTHAERIILFQLRQWSREGATLLRYTYIVYTVLTKRSMEVSNI